MPNITLYVTDSALPIVEKAKKRLGESLSAVFIDCVQTRLNSLANTPTGKLAKIVLTFWNDEQEPVIHKSFMGRWLVGGEDEGLRAVDDSWSWDAGAEYSVAQTAKGNLVVYRRHCNEGFEPKMDTYPDFMSMKDANTDGYPYYPPNVIAETAAALGKPYEIELDI